MRLLKNKTANDCNVTCGSSTVVVPANGQADLSEHFTVEQLASSVSLIELIGQGVSKYQLNDGVNDLSVSDAIDLVRNYAQHFPRAADGKPFFLPSIFPYELLMNFAGKPDSGGQRYAGSLFGLEKNGVGDASVDFSFQDGVFLTGGIVSWRDGGFGSYVSLEQLAPATTVVDPETPNTGNCNLVATGLGFNIIVPAAGNGAKNLGTTVVPVPAERDEDMLLSGYWDYTDPWLGKGEVSAGTPQAAKFNLFDAQVKLSHFCDLHLVPDQGVGDAFLHSVKPTWILPQWVWHVVLHNAHANKIFQVGWDLVLARKKSV